MPEKVIVLGAGFLGVNVVLDLMESEKEVVLIDEDLNHEYIPGLIELIRERKSEEDLLVDLKDFLSGEDVSLHEESVETIKPEKNEVETAESVHSYDQLVLGLGGCPKNMGLDIDSAENIWGIEPAGRLVENLESAEKVIVVGSGYTGLEAAMEIAETGREVVIVELKTRPCPRLSEKSSEKFLEIMQKKGVSFRGGQKVEEIQEEKVLTEEDSMEGDMVLWCGGVQASKIVQESFKTGLAGLKVTKGLSAEKYGNIYAGGDIADTKSLKTAHNAMKQAVVIAENIKSGDLSLKRFEDDRLPLIVSLGDTGAIVLNKKVVWTGFPSRFLKDMVRVFYFLRLRWKRFF